MIAPKNNGCPCNLGICCEGLVWVLNIYSDAISPCLSGEQYGKYLTAVHPIHVAVFHVDSKSTVTKLVYQHMSEPHNTLMRDRTMVVNAVYNLNWAVRYVTRLPIRLTPKVTSCFWVMRLPDLSFFLLMPKDVIFSHLSTT